MKGSRVDLSIRQAIAAEYLSGGITLRELEKKYGYRYAIIGRWVRTYRDTPDVSGVLQQIKRDNAESVKQELPVEVKLLQDQLRLAQLKNQLLEAMLDIGKEQFGLDLRKKSGTKQS